MRLPHASPPDGRRGRTALVLAGAGAGVAAWLYLTEGRGESAGRIAPVVGPGAVGVQGTF